MNRYRTLAKLAALSAALACVLVVYSRQTSAGSEAGNSPSAAKVITEADCTSMKLGPEIPKNAIGEPVSAVTLNAPQWHAQANSAPAYCGIEGSMAPVDRSDTARPIRFGVALPASWGFRGAQMGGGGNNGTIPRLTGGVGRGGPSLLQQGFATYGSDSGHQSGGFAPPPGAARGGAPAQAPQGVPIAPGAVPGGRGPDTGMPAMAARGQGMPPAFAAPNPTAVKP